MAHTTSIYYRDRLGFEPESDPSQNQQTHPYHAQYSAAAESTTASPAHPRSATSSTKTRKTRTMKTHRESTMSSSATSTVVRESHYSGTTASASNMGGTTSSSHHVTSSSSRVMSSANGSAGNGHGHLEGGGQSSYSIRDYSDSYRDRDLRERDVTRERYLEENSASTLTGGVYEENLTKFKGKTVSTFAV